MVFPHRLKPLLCSLRLTICKGALPHLIRVPKPKVRRPLDLLKRKLLIEEQCSHSKLRQKIGFRCLCVQLHCLIYHQLLLHNLYQLFLVQPYRNRKYLLQRTSASDGYNWRKYGQKQVKSPTGSRSYYRCTHSDCCAKKIECCDDSGHVIEIVYKSEHSHDPPRKTNSIRENKFLSSSEPIVENSVPEQPIKVLKDADPSISSKESLQEAPCSTDKKRQNTSNISGNGKVILKEEHVNEPVPKKRMKKGDLTDMDSPVKPGKKSKFVVHAAGDVGISADGYRWRKYGQKMVKGNPHPRNYYRCTSAGCPVRKHIETAVDNSDAVIITYKGVHDHDMPVPKKRHGPPSAPLVAAAAPASLNSLQAKKSDSPQNKKISTQWSVDTEGELTGEALELGGEKAMESARTLLSIGFEIKPC
ncbi:putative WRKY transcription factor 32 isoform C [Glycine soja]|uniref:Putative WRKY transcription factor 32 isoform C n=1 Tax=Glycine soja TaxID=3848 RepID=A0A445G3G9_GLYSO|nr:putative WRKY transcription factor 32 isoform C [Glycine soja]